MLDLIPMRTRSSFDSIRDMVMDAFEWWAPEPRKEQPTEFLAGTPAVDVVEEGDHVKVTAELPGMTEKDFTVEAQEDRLILRGEKKSEKKEKKRNYYYSELSYGSFSRTIPLPVEVDAAKAQANFKNGVLEITLPKTENSARKKIDIKVR